MKTPLDLCYFNYCNQYKDYSVIVCAKVSCWKKTMVDPKRNTVCKGKTVKYKAGNKLFVLPSRGKE